MELIGALSVLVGNSVGFGVETSSKLGGLANFLICSSTYSFYIL